MPKEHRITLLTCVGAEAGSDDMGDRLIGEAPEYTLERVAACRDQIWPHVTGRAAFSHLQATLDALQIQPNEKIAAPLSQQVLPT